MKRLAALAACVAVLAAGAGIWLLYSQDEPSKGAPSTSDNSATSPSEPSGQEPLWAADDDAAFDEPDVAGVPLAEATGSMGHPVSLLPTEEAGEVAKVLAGEWGMGVRYASGATLVVNPRRDLEPEYRASLAAAKDGSVVYADGKQHVQAEEPPDPALAASPGVQAYSVVGGTQILSGGGTWRVRTQLYWNDANFTYVLYSTDDTAQLEQLRQLMMHARAISSTAEITT